ncbi:MAG: glycosyltransferase family 39 protein [Chloroflexi bacterium]|nr:glycosyltransferase family 39 protein [Chloroflexota bacterium]
MARVWWLERQSFWLDEGFSAALTGGSLGYILRQSFTVEPNPPVYFLLLHLWRFAAGDTEYGIRFLSVLPSVLAGPVTYLVARRLGGRRAGVLAAALMALNPYLVWLAQEARMYSWALLWTVVGAYFLLRGLRGGRRLDWVLFTLANLLAVYTHLYSAFVVLAEAVYLLAIRRPRWLASTVLTGLLFLPWFVSVSTYAGESSTWRGFVGVWDMVRLLAINVASQGHLPGALDDVLALLLSLAAAAGCTVMRRRALPLVWLLLPVAAVYAVSFKEPLFSPRYFIVVLPAFLVLAGVGLAALPASAGLAGLAVLSAGSGWAIERGQFVSSYAKEDYRTAARYIEQRSQPADAIVLVANYIEYPFAYYFHGAGKLIPLDVQPNGNLEPLLAPLASYDHVWLVEAHDVFVDPQFRVIDYLRARYPVETDQYIIAVHFMEFATHTALAAPPVGVRAGGALGSGPALAGWQAESRPGGELVALYWPTTPHPTTDFHLSLKLWASNGELAGQQDGEPLNAGLPFTKFPPSGVVRDEHFVDALPGTYDLRLSLYPPGGADVGQMDLGQVTVGS